MFRVLAIARIHLAISSFILKPLDIVTFSHASSFTFFKNNLKLSFLFSYFSFFTLINQTIARKHVN